MKQYLSFLMVLLVVLSIAVPMGSADTAQSSATVTNEYPQFMEFRMSDDDGESWTLWIEYHSNPSYSASNGAVYQDGHFEDLWINGASADTKYSGGSGGAAIAPNSDEYRVILTPGAETISVLVQVKLVDANGYDDISGAQVAMLINSIGQNIAPGSITMTYQANHAENTIDTAVYGGTFDLYSTTPMGQWLIAFKFRDTAMAEDIDWQNSAEDWYFTHSAQFYVGAYVEIIAAAAGPINFGSIDPNVVSNEQTTSVTNEGNVPVTVSITPEEMGHVGGGTQTLYPWTSGAFNSNGSVGGIGSENGNHAGSLNLEALNTWVPAPGNPVPVGYAKFKVRPEMGIQAGVYQDNIVFTATQTTP